MNQQKVGATWVDTTFKADNRYFYQFIIQKVESLKAQLYTKIQRVSAAGTANWEGIMWVNLSNGFIYEMKLQGESQNKRNVMGSIVVLTNKFELSVANKQ